MDRRSESAIEGLAFVAKHVDTDYKRTLLGVAEEEIQRLAAEIERHKPKQLTDDEACSLLNEIAYDGVCDWTPDEYGHGYIQSASLRQGMGTWTAHAIAAQVLREKEAKA